MDISKCTPNKMENSEIESEREMVHSTHLARIFIIAGVFMKKKHYHHNHDNSSIGAVVAVASSIIPLKAINIIANTHSQSNNK